ncbi:ADP-ribosylation factor-related protein 1 isoform X4 [Puntigrus tetrazona]|uniref:ADP-ribosylation factor-related protein 1 isoform X4 n=1 Tax=Puntigrus tetrazona TaxID=1606681 RepID=UPI001C89568A|nr:ADP-ribosylation factor-related protein 1 isoform X4 [Puntigrus tetrazona]
MYTLLSGLYKYMFQKDEYCILILGLDNAGKTTFLEQTKTKFSKNYKGMNLSKITTTVGLNIGTIDVGKARLMFWDLGGQEELQSLWDKYYAESHGVIYVIDSTDEERLGESKNAFEKMISSEVLEGVPLLVLANKQDVEAGCERRHRMDGQMCDPEHSPPAQTERHHIERSVCVCVCVCVVFSVNSKSVCSRHSTCKL